MLFGPVCSPHSTEAAATKEQIHFVVRKLMLNHSSALIVISEDFNHVAVSSMLSRFSQYVECNIKPVRPLLYSMTKVKEAYTPAGHLLAGLITI